MLPKGEKCRKHQHKLNEGYRYTPHISISSTNSRIVIRIINKKGIKEHMCIKCESPLENKFHEAWMNYSQTKNVQLTTQIIVPVVSRYVKVRRIDFGFPNLKLGIEIQSVQFHSTPSQMKNDRIRRAELKRQGWKLVYLEGPLVYSWPTVAVNRAFLAYLKEKKRQNSLFYKVSQFIIGGF